MSGTLDIMAAVVYGTLIESSQLKLRCKKPDVEKCSIRLSCSILLLPFSFLSESVLDGDYSKLTPFTISYAFFTRNIISLTSLVLLLSSAYLAFNSNTPT
jgi:hypothetical protein